MLDDRVRESILFIYYDLKLNFKKINQFKCIKIDSIGIQKKKLSIF